MSLIINTDKLFNGGLLFGDLNYGDLFQFRSEPEIVCMRVTGRERYVQLSSGAVYSGAVDSEVDVLSGELTVEKKYER